MGDSFALATLLTQVRQLGQLGTHLLAQLAAFTLRLIMALLQMVQILLRSVLSDCPAKGSSLGQELFEIGVFSLLELRDLAQHHV